MKCRRVTYLGLLPRAKGGFSEITKMYVAVFGIPGGVEALYFARGGKWFAGRP